LPCKFDRLKSVSSAQLESQYVLRPQLWSKTFTERIAKSKLAKFGLSDSLSKITLLFDLSLYLDQTYSSTKGSVKS